MVANAFLPLEPRICSQSEHVIIGKTSTSERPSKGSFLIWRWIEPEAVCSFHIHSHSLQMLCYDVKQERNAIPPLPKVSGLLAQNSA